LDPNRVNNLFNLGLFNIKLGLDNIKNLLKKLNNPHLHPRIIHIAGTNGKGSTLVALEKLLLDSGFSTGSTISPHLVAFNERFRINGQSIDDDMLERVYLTVCKACDLHPDLSPESLESGDIRPTFFEFSVAMAFVLFREYDVDYILLETGLGGRLDATNVVENPLINIITRIALDHQNVLGNTLEQIAVEKLGIVKPGSTVISALQEDSVMNIVEKTCSANSNVLYSSPKHFKYLKADSDEFAVFDVSSLSPETETTISRSPVRVIKSGLIGEHQKENLVTALAAYTCLVPINRQLNAIEISNSFRSLNWQGRLEYLEGRPDILLDVAHNVSGMITLLNHLHINHSNERILFAIGWTKHHELISAFDNSQRENCEFLPIQMQNERSLSGEIVFKALKDKRFRVHLPIGTQTLVSRAKKHTLPKSDLLVVAGSLYLVGEFLAEWGGATVQI